MTGKSEWREDIQAYEYYESDYKCPKLNDAAKALGTLGGLMTAKEHGTKHYSEARKKRIKSEVGKMKAKTNTIKEKTNKWKCWEWVGIFISKKMLACHLVGEYEEASNILDIVTDQMHDLNIRP